MAATILDGNKIAARIKAEIADDVRVLAAADVRPRLAAILVGSHPASEIHVRSKLKACETLGIAYEKHTLSESIDSSELLNKVQELNCRDDIDGIILELPLPAHLDHKSVLLAVDPAKDVDGFHFLNIGFLATRRPRLVPCTAAGVIEILKRSRIQISGAEAVVVGRSDVVGKPVAALLLNHDATVTVCHSKTRDLPAVCRRADILVVAIGRPGYITREFLKPGATVIDIGINRVTDREEFDRLFRGDAQRALEFKQRGSTLVGDVHPEVAEIAGAITPVPGGVGPLTIAMLMVNIVKATQMRRGAQVSPGEFRAGSWETLPVPTERRKRA